MDTDYDIKHQFTHDQQIAMSKELPKFNKNWKKECRFLHAKYKWQDSILRENTFGKDWNEPQIRATVILQLSKLCYSLGMKEEEKDKDGKKKDKKKKNEELIAKYLTTPKDNLMKSKLPNLDEISKKRARKKEDYIKAFKPFIEDAEKFVIWEKKRKGLITPPQKGGAKPPTDIRKATHSMN